MTREDMVEAIMPHMGYAGDVMAREAAQAALSALEAMGCVVVPREPTSRMIGDAWATAAASPYTGPQVIELMWSAMLAAASPLPAQGRG